MDDGITKEDFDELKKLIIKLNGKPKVQPQYLRLEQAPDYVSITAKTFKKWRDAGLVPTTVIGGITVVNKDDLDALMLKYRVGNV